MLASISQDDESQGNLKLEAVKSDIVVERDGRGCLSEGETSHERLAERQLDKYVSNSSLVLDTY